VNLTLIRELMINGKNFDGSFRNGDERVYP
jgi:hypothetical protein